MNTLFGPISVTLAVTSGFLVPSSRANAATARPAQPFSVFMREVIGTKAVVPSGTRVFPPGIRLGPLSDENLELVVLFSKAKGESVSADRHLAPVDSPTRSEDDVNIQTGLSVDLFFLGLPREILNRYGVEPMASYSRIGAMTLRVNAATAHELKAFLEEQGHQVVPNNTRDFWDSSSLTLDHSLQTLTEAANNNKLVVLTQWGADAQADGPHGKMVRALEKEGRFVIDVPVDRGPVPLPAIRLYQGLRQLQTSSQFRLENIAMAQADLLRAYPTIARDAADGLAGGWARLLARISEFRKTHAAPPDAVAAYRKLLREEKSIPLILDPMTEFNRLLGLPQQLIESELRDFSRVRVAKAALETKYPLTR